jgi:hypothetical protein
VVLRTNLIGLVLGMGNRNESIDSSNRFGSRRKESIQPKY